jgi:hypothetical protein
VCKILRSFLLNKERQSIFGCGPSKLHAEAKERFIDYRNFFKVFANRFVNLA